MSEHRAREKFAVLVLVEPGAFDVEKAKPGEPGQCEGIDGELGERPVGAGVGLVVENMHRAVPHLQKVDMAGDGLVVRRTLGEKPDAVVAFKRGDVGTRQPDKQISTSTATVTESLASMKQRLVPPSVEGAMVWP